MDSNIKQELEYLKGQLSALKDVAKGKAQAVYREGTIMVLGWNEDMNIIVCKGLKPDDKAVISITEDATEEQVKAFADASIYCSGVSELGIRIKALDKIPGIDIPVDITIIC